MAQKILVAEDEKPLASALALKLKSAGYDVSTVADGQQALETLAKEKFDVLLLDLIMPKLDGFMVLEAIGKSMPDMHIMVLTNLGQEEDLKRVTQYGVKDFFVKSDTPIADIIHRVNTLLAHGTA
jgi:two-component system alkaline phosphatase synthesis response regulator PhoP